MKTIYKYIIETTDSQFVKMPKGSEILCIQSQFEDAVIYALVDTDEKEIEERCIEIFGTGQEICYDMGVSRSYIGTYQLSGGNYVFHAFEYTGV